MNLIYFSLKFKNLSTRPTKAIFSGRHTPKILEFYKEVSMSIRNSLAVLAIALVEISASTAQADETSRQEIISEMFDVLYYDEMMNQTATVVADQLLIQIKVSMPGLDAEMESEVREITRAFFLDRKPEMELILGQFMSRHFSEDELRQILAYNKSDVGRKWIQLTPQLTQEIVAWMQETLANRTFELREAIEVILQK